jgi:hypothetical protein
LSAKARIPRPRGRPGIEDALAICLYVRVGAKRAGVSVRAFCFQRGTEFGPESFPPAYGRNPIEKDSLRRRYGDAQHAIGLRPARWKGIVVPADPGVKETIDRMVRDLVGSK